MGVTQNTIKAGRAFVELFADSSTLSKGLRIAEQKIRDFGSRMQSMGIEMTLLGAGATVPFANATKAFADFDDKMRLVRAVTEETGKGFDRLTAQALRIGSSSSFSADTVADMMTELGRAGFSGTEINQATQAILDLSRATGTDLSNAAAIAVGTMRSFGLNSSQMTDIVDILTVGANKSAQSLEDIGVAMRYAGPVAKEFGMSLRDTVKALSVMAQFNIKGHMGGTSIRNIILRLTRSPIRKILTQQLGVDTAFINGQMRPFADIMEDIGVALSRMPEVRRIELLDQIFGMRAITGGAKLTKESFDSINKALNNFRGTTRRTAEEMDAGIGGSFRKTINAVKGLAISVGKTLAPPVKTITDIFRELTGTLSEYLDKNKGIILWAAALSAKFLVIGSALLDLGLAFKVSGLYISLALAPLKAVIAGISILASTALIAISPLGRLTAAVVAFVVKSGLWSKVLDGLQAKVKAFADVTRESFSVIGEAIQKGDLSSALNVSFGLVKVGWLTVVTEMTEVWLKFKTTILTAAGGMVTGFLNAVGQMVSGIDTLLTHASATAKGVYATLKGEAVKAYLIYDKMKATRQLDEDYKKEEADNDKKYASQYFAQDQKIWRAKFDGNKAAERKAIEEKGEIIKRQEKELDAIRGRYIDKQYAIEEQYRNSTQGMDDETTKEIEKLFTDSAQRNQDMAGKIDGIIKGLGTKIADALSMADIELSPADQARLDELNRQLAEAKAALVELTEKTKKQLNPEAMTDKQSLREAMIKANERYQKARREHTYENDPAIRALEEEEIRRLPKDEQGIERQFRKKMRDITDQEVLDSKQALKDAQDAYHGRTQRGDGDGANYQPDRFAALSAFMQRFMPGQSLQASFGKLSAQGSFSGFSRFGVQGESAADRMAAGISQIAENTGKLVSQGYDAAESGGM